MQINGKEIDYDKIVKVTIGDIEDLESRGISLQTIREGNLTVSNAIDFIALFAARANDAVTRDDVRTLGVDELQTHSDKIAERINAGQEHTGDPSS